MSNISIRLPEDVLDALQVEAERQQKKRSELIRVAVMDYLRQSKQDRFLTTMVEEAKAVYGDAALRQEALEIAEDFDAVEKDSGPDDRWWQ
jgi:metal-responsive CopG/Arc/MetJ family transcriptional regulator